MSFDTAKKTMDNLVPLSGHDILIGFYGGEPLINRGLIQQIIDYSKKRFPSKEFMFSMTTNFFDSDKYVKGIVDNKMYINLSLDGPKEIHDKSRKTKTGKPTYDKIISNLRKIEKYSPGYLSSHVSILTLCDDPNDLPKIIEFFNQKKYFVARINRPDPKGRIIQEKRTPERYMGEVLLKKFRERILKGEEPKMLRRLFDLDLKTMAVRDDRIMPKKLMLNGSCYPGRKRIFVDVDGNYHPCERFGHRLKIGSVEKGIQQKSIGGMISSFAQIRNELCGECWAQRICTPCLQHAKDSEGEISIRGLSQTCDGKRGQLLTGLENYVTLIQSDKQKTEDYIQNINPLFERGLC